MLFNAAVVIKLFNAVAFVVIVVLIVVVVVVVVVVISNSSSKSGGYSCRKTDCYLCTVKPVRNGHSKR